jgi:hypothetical protein
MSTRSGSRHAAWLALALAVSVVLACGTGSSVVGGSTSTPQPTTTSALPPPHAIAWVQQDGNNMPQIWASVNDGPPTQITHQPAKTPECGFEVFGPPMFSPDLQHIAVADGSTCGDAQYSGDVFIITVSSGAIADVPQAYVLTDERSYGWIDNHTIFIVGNYSPKPGGMVYTLGAGSPIALPGMPPIVIEGVVRGSTLFYVTADVTSAGGYPAFHSVLHRYSLSTHSNLTGTIDLGGFGMFPGSPGDFHYAGWDASADGTHVVYQVTVPQRFVEASGGGGIASQAVYYAHADGSGASQIVQYMVTRSLIRLRLSPNGKQVGITEAHGTPDVLSGCVDSPGLRGDPCLEFYSPDAYGYPAWHWDNSYMVATAAASSFNGVLYRDTPGHFAGVVYAAAGYNPWSTP